MIKAEQETTIRWDQEERIAHLWTAYEPDARRWERAGYVLRVSNLGKDGSARGWRTEVPIEAIRWRRVEAGAVVKRQGHSKGRRFGVATDELVAAEL